jgi:hypothetical protein
MPVQHIIKDLIASLLLSPDLLLIIISVLSPGAVIYKIYPRRHAKQELTFFAFFVGNIRTD